MTDPPPLDLFVTYTALTAFAEAGLHPSNEAVTAQALRALGSAEGIGPVRGAEPDVWSTAYGVWIFQLLDQPPPYSWAQFLACAHDRGAFVGGRLTASDAWATSFAGCGLTRGYGLRLPDPEATLAWIGRCQTGSGGLTWSPEWTPRNRPALKATGLLLQLLESAGLVERLDEQVDRAALVHWLRGRQTAEGSFQSDPGSPGCVWGCGEAVESLRILGSAARDPAACVDFILSLRQDDGGFARDGGRCGRSDIWSTAYALRTLRTLGHRSDTRSRELADSFLTACTLPHGGFASRPELGPATAYEAAGALLTGKQEGRDAAVAYLRDCRMDGEGGYGYMPARGAEARATLWAVTGLREIHETPDADAVLRWAAAAQNPDGGFGIFYGRASCATATCAVVGALTGLNVEPDQVIDVPRLRVWLSERWARLDPLAADADLVETAALFRTARRTGLRLDPRPATGVLRENLAGCAWRRRKRAVPDLMATYQALLIHQELGTLREVLPGTADWVGALRRPDGATSWTQLSSRSGGPIAEALACAIGSAARTPNGELPDLII